MITQSLKQLKREGHGPVSAGTCAKTYVFVQANFQRSHAGFRDQISRGDFVHGQFDGLKRELSRSFRSAEEDG